MRDYTASVTQEQRDYMANIVSRSFTPSMEVRSNALRDWYNAGQRFFRETFGSASALNDLEFEQDIHREGFLMGWNSDAWAMSNGKDLSVLGGQHVVLDDIGLGMGDSNDDEEVEVVNESE